VSHDLDSPPPTGTGPTVTFAWRPNGPDVETFDGDEFLVAIQLRDSRDASLKWTWQLDVVRITEDGVETAEGDHWGWSWDDVEWYVPVADLAPTK
jgi:hypothetical protein